MSPRITLLSPRWLLFGLAFAVLTASAARAQTGTISGLVVDQDTQAPLEGAKVSARHSTMGNTLKATTNGKGSYRIVNARYGEYEVSVEKEGYYPFKGTFVIEPKSNDVTTLNVQIKSTSPPKGQDKKEEPAK